MFRGLFPRLWLLGLVAVLAGTTLSSAQAQDASPTAVVERFHNTLIANMKDGKTLGFGGRHAKLAPVVKDAFDIHTMARISTGSAWAKIPPAEQTAIAEAFAHWTVASYAGNFSAWDGEAFVTKDQSADDGKGNVVVNTQLNLKSDKPVLFTYRLHKADCVWKIFDIYLDGAISQLAMRRGEFAAVLGKGTPADLIAHMNKLAVDANKD
jgi:phospholipid transport system substrate-binding protein